MTRKYEVPTRLTEPLERAAQQSPDATAVEDPYGAQLSYRQLNELADRVAHCLAVRGVKAGDRVGLCLPKCALSVAAIYGILKNGAAYVPVDHSAPSERNRYIFHNCRTATIITDEIRGAELETESRADDNNGLDRLLIASDATDPAASDRLPPLPGHWRPTREPAPHDLAYILYTSGSTGLPKGVMHSHASALSFVMWSAETFRPEPWDRFSSHAPFHFDLSVLDLYLPALSAAALVIVSEDLGKNPRSLAAYIAERRITAWYSVPSVLSLLVEHGRLKEQDTSALRLVLFAGEVFPIGQLRALRELWPGKALFNLYGPTETNVCTYHPIPDPIPAERSRPFPIGQPCTNARILILDEQLTEVTSGEEGLLYVHCSGPTMLGYWGDPERTESSIYVDGDGERWYNTGDLVIADAHGTLDFVGRRDRMVKRHGHRIELGEIEAGLYKHRSIDEAAAVATNSESGTSITAFVCPRPGDSLSIIELKRHCASVLPGSMSPDRFRTLEALPRTSTAKVDYPALVRLVAEA